MTFTEVRVDTTWLTTEEGKRRLRHRKLSVRTRPRVARLEENVTALYLVVQAMSEQIVALREQCGEAAS